MDREFNPYFQGDDEEWTGNSLNRSSTTQETSSYPYMPLVNSNRYDSLPYTHSQNSPDRGSSSSYARAAKDHKDPNSSPSSTSSRTLHTSMHQSPQLGDANPSRREQRRRPRISPNKWEEIRPAFTELYIGQYKTLAETMGILSEMHGFNASEKLFKDKIRAWGLAKNTKQNLEGFDREREGGRRKEHGIWNAQNTSMSNLTCETIEQTRIGAVPTPRTSSALHNDRISPDSVFESPELAFAGELANTLTPIITSDMEAAYLKQRLLHLRAQEREIIERLLRHHQQLGTTELLSDSVESYRSQLQTVPDYDDVGPRRRIFGAEQQITDPVISNLERQWMGSRVDYRHVLPDTGDRPVNHSNGLVHHAEITERGFPDRTHRPSHGSVPHGSVPHDSARNTNLRLENTIANPPPTSMPTLQAPPRREHRR